jgi:hypothetical protein
MIFRLILLVLLCALPARAASDFFKDKVGDLKFNEPALQCMDISTVKVTTADRKTFTFEVKTKAPISDADAENPLYFIVAVNSDGDISTGTFAWTPGQDFCAFIHLQGSSIKNIRTMGDDKAISAVSIEDNTLRFTLTFEANKQRRITFNVRSMIRRQSEDGKAPYSVLDSSVQAGERFNEFKL